jgi:hypothetical protein
MTFLRRLGVVLELPGGIHLVLSLAAGVSALKRYILWKKGKTYRYLPPTKPGRRGTDLVSKDLALALLLALIGAFLFGLGFWLYRRPG